MENAEKKPRLLRVPQQCRSREMLLGTIAKLDSVENVVCLIMDEDGVWLLHDGATCERINWMLDRAKLNLHEPD
jgi:hypothetical protein